MNSFKTLITVAFAVVSTVLANATDAFPDTLPLGSTNRAIHYQVPYVKFIWAFLHVENGTGSYGDTNWVQRGFLQPERFSGTQMDELLAQSQAVMKKAAELALSVEESLRSRTFEITLTYETGNDENSVILFMEQNEFRLVDGTVTEEAWAHVHMMLRGMTLIHVPGAVYASYTVPAFPAPLTFDTEDHYGFIMRLGDWVAILSDQFAGDLSGILTLREKNGASARYNMHSGLRTEVVDVHLLSKYEEALAISAKEIPAQRLQGESSDVPAVLRIAGLPGREVVIESSSDLNSWSNSGTATIGQFGNGFFYPFPHDEKKNFFRAHYK